MTTQNTNHPPPGFLYLTAARGIQDFILRGNKLREMIGGSQIVDQLTGKEGSLLYRLLAEIGLDPGDAAACRALTAAAGGARLWIADEAKASQLFRLWPFVAAHHAPGIEVVQVLLPVGANLAATLAAAETELVRRRNRAFPRLPLAGPLVARAPRTGEPAVEHANKEAEWCDAQQAAKRNPQDQSAHSFSLARRISERLGLEWKPKEWPLDFAEITTRAGERNYLALIHADGNSLGQTWMHLLRDAEKSGDNEQLFSLYRAFSGAIEETSLHALTQALRPILEGAQADQSAKFPVRPILCAGDDVTLVLRADLALTFAKDYLLAFEEKSGELLAEVKARHGHLAGSIPPGLRAGMGIAFVKERFPFTQAYALCESLCKCVKQASREHSGMAFHRVTTSATADYSELRETELSSRDGQQCLTLNPYFLKRPDTRWYPLIGDLEEAVKASTLLPRGPLRETVAEAALSVALAEKRFERLREVAQRREGAQWEAFESAMRRLVGSENAKIPLWKEIEGAYATPLNDILELKAFSRFENAQTPSA